MDEGQKVKCKIFMANNNEFLVTNNVDCYAIHKIHAWEFVITEITNFHGERDVNSLGYPMILCDNNLERFYYGSILFIGTKRECIHFKNSLSKEETKINIDGLTNYKGL